jgi:hypothetical protein
VDTARQILRYSIPGSIFLLYGAVDYLLYRRIQGVSFVEASGPLRENVAAGIAVLAAIPVGFLIYQAYYFSYKPLLRIWSIPWKTQLVRRDRGGQVLRTLDPDQLGQLEEIFNCKIHREEIHRVVPDGKSPLQRLMHLTGVLEIDGDLKVLEKKARGAAYEERWYTHWDVLRSIAASQSEHLKAEYTSLSDLYHSLGAARTAVVMAWVGACLLAVTHAGRVGDGPARAAIGFGAISALAAATYLILHIARGRTWQTTASSLSFGLRWLRWQERYSPPGTPLGDTSP